MRTLVTGGIRSGKSARAEQLLAHLPATYLATGPVTEDDPAWAERVRHHRERRPAAWTTVESTDVPAVLAAATGPVLLDELGTWVSHHLGEVGAWGDEAGTTWRAAWTDRVDALLTAVAGFDHELVVVSGEVGFSLVSEYASGRLFADELGRLNQAVAARCHRVELVVAGCPLTVKDAR
ncbi:bifunctional adenosylcobinamide kinase/adenosylcobinamide-phosphate guanylyltransferase [Kytococcus schroeteri]|uniref:bifunctional adenosylcobinamide kinase/adenosylcobinamide-phosphate guanylyltransferase n=1 Tax=Kytococcus schroeteri TaxID=138300 RepID=UPI0011416F77|nr:bifunctional adenosylcobinamide kinase/adenosylcobinamide-phosphate guanylyltransferase [Kytococcus schroeteri]